MLLSEEWNETTLTKGQIGEGQKQLEAVERGT